MSVDIVEVEILARLDAHHDHLTVHVRRDDRFHRDTTSVS